jgi:hypothetical protein
MASKKLILILLCVIAMTFVVVGCGGDDDKSPAAPPVDTAPPALPSGLSAQYSQDSQSATVSWDQNVTDSDFAGFLVSRSSYDMQPEALVSEPQAANSYQDNDLGTAGRVVTYYVYAVDESGNVSAASTVAIEMEPAPQPANGRDYLAD